MRGAVRIWLILFFAGQLVILSMIPQVRLNRGLTNVILLVLVLLYAGICFGLARSLKEQIEEDSRRQALFDLRHMEFEQLAAILSYQEPIEEIQKKLQEKTVTAASEDDLSALSCSICANPVVDAVLFQKQEIMKQKGLRVHFLVSLPERLPIEPSVLISLFSNLLDNAMEAASKCPEGWIRLEAYVRKGQLICICENTVEKEARITPGHSTKPALGHGHGLQILDDLCTSHHGFLSYKIENGQAQFVAALSV